VIDGPPLLGAADVRPWAQYAEAVLVAARPERLSPADAVETRERLERSGASILGYVVVGASRNDLPSTHL
jgi:Mrp family chromosome partitioning ATPase